MGRQNDRQTLGQTDRQIRDQRKKAITDQTAEIFQAYMSHNERKSCHDTIKVGTSGPACIKLYKSYSRSVHYINGFVRCFDSQKQTDRGTVRTTEREMN